MTSGPTVARGGQGDGDEQRRKISNSDDRGDVNGGGMAWARDGVGYGRW